MANTFKKLAVILIIATTITGCGSGQSAVTRNIKQVTDGAEAESNGVKLRNVLIVKTDKSEGVLVATIVNTTDEVDSIVGIEIGDAMATVVAKSSELVKNKPIIFEGDSANADAFIPVLNNNAGDRIGITFRFTKASPVTISALVVNSEGIYQGLVRSTPAIVAPATPAP